jgi:hypothetical protein
VKRRWREYIVCSWRRFLPFHYTPHEHSRNCCVRVELPCVSVIPPISLHTSWTLQELLCQSWTPMCQHWGALNSFTVLEMSILRMVYLTSGKEHTWCQHCKILGTWKYNNIVTLYTSSVEGTYWIKVHESSIVGLKQCMSTKNILSELGYWWLQNSPYLPNRRALCVQKKHEPYMVYTYHCHSTTSVEGLDFRNHW